MPFIQENHIEINIGLKNKYKLIQISDVHAVTYRTEEDKEEAFKAEELWYRQRTWFADKASEYYDEDKMIPSKDCLINLIDYINKEEPNVAILSGDIIDYYSKSNYALLTSEVNRIKVPYIFSIGNHETPGESYKELTKSEIGFSKIDLGEFKIVSIDNSTKSVNKDTLSCFKKELEERKPVIVAMHIPISTRYNKEEMKKYDPYFVIDEDDTDEITKEFINLLINNEYIKAILCGHTHGHSETYFAPNKLEVCASSGLIGLVNKIIVK